VIGQEAIHVKLAR